MRYELCYSRCRTMITTVGYRCLFLAWYNYERKYNDRFVYDIQYKKFLILSVRLVPGSTYYE